MKKILIILSLFIGLGINAQNIWHVNNITGMGPDGTGFFTFGEALTAASDGDIIYVYGSPLPYSGTISKQLTIIGPGYFLEENGFAIDGQNGMGASAELDLSFSDGSEGSKVVGIDFIDKIFVNVPNLEFESCQFLAHYSYSNYPNSNIFIQSENCQINKCILDNRIYFDSGCDDAYVSNSIVLGSIVSNSQFIGGAVVENCILRASAYSKFTTFINNTFFDVLYSCGDVYDQYNSNTYFNNISICENSNLPEGNGNQINIAPNTLFVGYNNDEYLEGFSEDARYQLAPGSPAIGAGMNGEDCGVFGGADPYVLSGLPSIPTIYELNVPSFAPEDNSLPVEVKVKSNN